MESKVLINKLPQKPIVDRTNKPSSGKKIPATPTASIEELEKQLEDARRIMSQMSKHCDNEWEKEQLDIYRKKEEELVSEIF